MTVCAPSACSHGIKVSIVRVETESSLHATDCFRLAIMEALSEANSTFALTLLKTLGEDSGKNVFFSPMSISATLAMVLMGAKGNTAAQMVQVPNVMEGNRKCCWVSVTSSTFSNPRGIALDGNCGLTSQGHRAGVES